MSAATVATRLLSRLGVGARTLPRPPATTTSAVPTPSSSRRVAARQLSMASKIVLDAKGGKPAGTVIFLHGLGDQGHGWASIIEQEKKPSIKYVLPNAPSIPVTLNMGMTMPAWFDIYSLDKIDGKEDEAGIQAAGEALEKLVAAEVEAGIPPERIVLAGFSQGGATALYTALTMKQKVGGVIGLSSFLPCGKQFPKEGETKLSGANAETPFLLCHGDADPVVNIKYGKLTHEKLEELGLKAEFKQYHNMQHSSCPQEMADVYAFIDSVLGA